MSTTQTTSDEKKPFVAKKPASPFNVDPYNNRGGRKGSGGAVSGGVQKINPKLSGGNKPVRGGSGGDR